MNPNPALQSGFDQAAALEVTGGDRQLLQELADLFQQECPKLLAALRAAAAAHDPRLIAAAAHKLRGSASSFGARAVVERLLLLEQQGKRGDLSGVGHALQDLEEAVLPLLAELKAFRP